MLRIVRPFALLSLAAALAACGSAPVGPDYQVSPEALVSQPAAG